MNAAKVYPIKDGPYRHLVKFEKKGFDTYKRKFRTKKEAETDCEAFNEKLLKEGSEGIHIGPREREQITTMLRILEGTGITPIRAAEIAKEQWAGSGGGQHVDGLLVDFLGHCERKKLAIDTIKDYKWRIGGFFADESIKLAGDITRKRIERFVYREANGTSAGNMLTSINTFCRWLVREEVLSSNPCEAIERPKKEPKDEVVIFQPMEAWRFMRRLEIARPHCVGFFAVLLFASLRPSEAEGLEDADFRKNSIKVTRGKMRGRSRRLARLSDQLKAWLEAYPFQVISDRQQRACRKLSPVKWKEDICRHSGISYRVAETNDVPLVAHESGNTEEVIRHDYLELMEPEDSELFHAIRPDTQKKPRFLRGL